MTKFRLLTIYIKSSNHMHVSNLQKLCELSLSEKISKERVLYFCQHQNLRFLE